MKIEIRTKIWPKIKIDKKTEKSERNQQPNVSIADHAHLWEG